MTVNSVTSVNSASNMISAAEQLQLELDAEALQEAANSAQNQQVTNTQQSQVQQDVQNPYQS